MASRHDLAERLIVRALLYAAPQTPVSTDEVAYALARSEEVVRRCRPASAFVPEGGRASVAPFGDWLVSLGYDSRSGGSEVLVQPPIALPPEPLEPLRPRGRGRPR